MNKLAGAILLLCVCAAQAAAQAAPSAADAVKQMERDWFNGVKAGDADKLSQLFADDWVYMTNTGPKETKAAYLADIRAGSVKLESYEIGSMDAKVIGNIAVVQGNDTEKSSYKGKDTSGQWVWMDVFMKRDGKWVAVRSSNAKML